MDDPKFLTFSESEAAENLRKCLDYFFGDDDGRKRYKFTDAYVKYSRFGNEDFLTSKRLFNVIKNTDLVREKVIMRVSSITGFIYLIDKHFFNKVERHIRIKNRQTSTQPDPTTQPSPDNTPSTKSSSSFVKLPPSAKDASDTTPPKSPHSQRDDTPSPTDAASIGQISMEDTWQDMNAKLAADVTDVAPTPDKTLISASKDTSPNIPSTVTKIADLMDQNIAETLHDINTPPHNTDTDLQHEIKNYITNEIAQVFSTKFSAVNQRLILLENHMDSIKDIENRLRDKHDTLEQEYLKKSQKLHQRFHWVNSKMDEYEKTFNHKYEHELQSLLTTSDVKIRNAIDQTLSTISDQMSRFNSAQTEAETNLNQMKNTLLQSSHNISSMDKDILPTAKTLKTVTNQLKHLVKEYQTRVEIMDATVDFLRDDFSTFKNDQLKSLSDSFAKELAKVKDLAYQSSNLRGSQTVTPQRHRRHHSSHHRPTSVRQGYSEDDESSSDADSDHVDSVRPSRHKSFHSTYQGVRTDLIRKNVKISCSDETCLLDFYTKLRTAMIQAGIYLRALEDITVADNIWEYKDGLTTHDYTLQSNALYTFLCNEDVIPQDFTFAQNCIKSQSTTMDGFSALKTMLSLVHPILNNRRPPHHPPVFSTFNDIHLYEQGLRNFYLLHSIYGRSEYTELDKSQQFLEGLDTRDYDAEKTRLTAILDNIELNSLDLTPKYTIHCLASTIMNMKTKENVVQINAFSQSRVSPTGSQLSTHTRSNRPKFGTGHADSASRSNFPYQGTHDGRRTNKFSSQFPAKQKFTKGQCDACKVFGHHVRDCRHIAKHLAMAKFASTKPKLCAQILQNHVNTNTEEQKRIFVRSMQTFGVFDDTADSDEFLDAEEVIHSPIVNKIDIHEPASNSKEE